MAVNLSAIAVAFLFAMIFLKPSSLWDLAGIVAGIAWLTIFLPLSLLWRLQVCDTSIAVGYIIPSKGFVPQCTLHFETIDEVNRNDIGNIYFSANISEKTSKKKTIVIPHILINFSDAVTTIFNRIWKLSPNNELTEDREQMLEEMLKRK